MQALKCHQRYSIGEKYNYKTEIEKSIIESLPLQIATRCCLPKIIRLVANLLKINPFQCSLLCWELRRTKCELFLYNFSLSSDVKLSMLQDPYDKKVFMLLLLNGYYVKVQLLSQGQEIDIDPQILQNVPNFDQNYKNWKPAKPLASVSLSQINKIFECWVSSKQEKKKIDYNKLVDKILYLSKTYNVGNAEDGKSAIVNNKDAKSTKSKDKAMRKGKAGHKKIKPNQQDSEGLQAEQESVIIRKTLVKNNINMLESNSNRIPWMDDQQFQLNPLRRSTRNMNRSLFDPKDDVNDSRHQLFRSKHSNNGNNGDMFNSWKGLNMNSINLNMNTSFGNNSFGGLFNSEIKESPAKLKPTISFDELK